MDEKERNPGMAAYCLDIISATLERTIRRLWVLCVVLALLLAGSWAGFLWYESQFEYVTETMEQYEAHVDGNGAAINNGSGEVNYGGDG